MSTFVPHGAEDVSSHYLEPEERFPGELEDWLVSCLIQEIDENLIVDALYRHGFPLDFVHAKIRGWVANPAIQIGRRLDRRRRKLLSLHHALGDLARQATLTFDCPVYDALSPSQFYAEFYYRNRPVVVRGLMDSWPALEIWTPSFFRERFGSATVEIAAGRNMDPRFEDNFEQHRRTVSFREYVDMLEYGGATNDYYLVAKNELLANPSFHALQEHFEAPPGYLRPERSERDPRMWLGPRGTLTPLHHDSCNIFFGQVYGRKHIKLLPPYDIDKVYNDKDCFSPVDLEAIDYDRFPAMRNASVLNIVVGPGDFLFIPIGWWHWVKALDVSISLSFQSFIGNDRPPVWEHMPVW